MAPLSETCALSSGKYVFEPGKSIPDLPKKLRFSWSHSSIFALEKQLKNLNFHRFFISNYRWVLSVKRVHSVLENMYLSKGWVFQIYQRNFHFLRRTPPLLLNKIFTLIKSEMLIFEDFLPLKKPLVATLSETCALTFRKYVAEDTKSNPKQFKSYKLPCLHSSVLALEF